jgi:PAS domain S-box-containing protein
VIGYNLLANPTVSSVVVKSRNVTERQLGEQALRRSEERFRALIERSSDMITLQQRDGTITYVSPSSDRVLGYQAGDLLGRQLLELVHADDQARVGRNFADLLETPGSVATLRYRVRHKDSSWRWIESVVTNLLEESAVGAIVVNRRDVTAEVEAQQLLEARVAERTLELTTLLELARGVGSTLQLEPLLQVILDQLGKVVPYSGAAILVLEGDDLVALDQHGPLPPGDFVRLRYRIADYGPAWDILRAGEPIRIADVRSDEPMARLFQQLVGDMLETSLGFIRACMWVPLITSGRAIGIFSIAHREPGYHTEQHARLALAFAQQAAAAMENARLFEAARGVAALTERQRLARELHDSVSQALYAIALNSAAAGESLRKQDAPRAGRLLRHVRQLARAGLAEMRALIFELRAESLAEEGLVAALTKQAAAVQARHELKIQTKLGSEPAIPLAAKEALYRIAQEALHNTVKHAQARTAELSLEVERTSVTLTVRDHGRGFAVDDPFPGHLGLRSMRERAEALGGSFTLQSAPRRGTTLRVELPVGTSSEPAVDGSRLGSAPS